MYNVDEIDKRRFHVIAAKSIHLLPHASRIRKSSPETLKCGNTFLQIKSCAGDRKQSLSKKYPTICPILRNESSVIAAINCEQHYEDPTNVKQVKKVSHDLFSSCVVVVAAVATAVAVVVSGQEKERGN